MPPKIPLSGKALRILRERYLLKDGSGRIKESPEQMFCRVSKAAGQPHLEKEFCSMMSGLEFLPSSPILMSAGLRYFQPASSFVLPAANSSIPIAERIHRSGGGTGFSLSGLKPGNTFRFISLLSNTISGTGRKAGASMATLNASHPDVLKFISASPPAGIGFSVAAPDSFMHGCPDVLERICGQALLKGCPGILFLDTINRRVSERIESSDACGEAPMPENGSCILGSFCLPRFLSKGELELGLLRDKAGLAARMLDGFIDSAAYPSLQISRNAESSRRLGIGVMGFADILASLQIEYDSKEAVRLAERIMRTVSKGARNESGRRNKTLTAVAPTGSISVIAGCSPGIEPFFIRKGKGSLYRTATEIPAEWHVRVQAAFQRHTDNAISKTVNLPESANIQDVENVFLLAWKLKCKGVTVYRDGGRKGHAIYPGNPGKRNDL